MIESAALQLGVAALVATIVFLAAYSSSQKAAATTLILLIPFQPVETRFFTANTLATYGVFIALMLRGSHIRLPMLPQILTVLFLYLISMGLVHPATYSQHAIYLGALISAFLVFWIAYDLTLRLKDTRSIVKVFLWINVIIAIYCSIQLYMGPSTKLVFFDNEDFAFMPMRHDNRLTGPFGAAGITAEYFVIMIFLLAHEILSTNKPSYRNALLVLIAVDMLMLITTGNRGGFLTLIGATGVFLWMFRRDLGPTRVFAILTGGSFLLVAAGAIAINYTDFGRLFDRLAGTEIEEGIPDTRQDLWPSAWKEIKRKPLLGHGPRLRFDGGDEGRRYTGHQYIRYPHNLYLYLTLTVGTLGLLGFLGFLMTPMIKCWLVSRLQAVNHHAAGLAKVGVVIMVVILVDQMKVSFMRISLVDYWHFLFAVFGMLVGACDRARMIAAAPRNVPQAAPVLHS